ncbi:MAG: hypothetical protein P8M36_00100, partial [Gammaproteobacteria bacterium]|nr:hypothetical protein [Gammaproteobacteria bacterium]
MSSISIFDMKYSDILLKNREFNETISKESDINISFLRNITIEPLLPYFQYECFLKNIRTNIYTCDYDNIMQSILDDSSELYAHKSKIIFIFISLELLDASFSIGFENLSEKEIKDHISEITKYYITLLDAIRSRTNSIIVLNTFEIPSHPSGGILDYQKKYGKINSFRK